MRALVVLLVVAAATGGFLLGRVTAPEAGGRGGERSAVPLTTVWETPSGQASMQPEAAPPEVGEPTEVPEQPDVVLPTRLTNVAEEEYEHLEVDFEGFQGERTAWVAVRTIQGGVTEEDWGVEAASYIGLRPGTYEVWWYDGEGNRLGTSAKIEVGKVTRLRAIDHRGPAPTPKGLGILKVHVGASWGGVIAGARVDICDWDNWECLLLETDARGQVTVALLPGRYHVQIGDQESEAVVEEGRTTLHRIGHVREGDLVPVSDRPLHVSVQRTEPPNGWSCRVDRGADAVIPYLAEGEYQVLLEGLVPLGGVVVRAGQTSRFRCEAPQGGIAVRLLKPGVERFGRAEVTIRRGIDGRETKRDVNADVTPDPVNLDLPPGCYVVTASADGCEPASAVIEVSDRVVEVTLELPRLR